MSEQPVRPVFEELCSGILGEGTPVRFRAGGSSMRPVIRDGDILVVEPMDGELPRRGEVVMAAGPGGLRAHRVLLDPRESGGQIVLRGDALGECDEPLPPERLIGRVRQVLRSGRPVRVEGPAVAGTVAVYRLARRLVPGIGRLRRSLAVKAVRSSGQDRMVKKSGDGQAAAPAPPAQPTRTLEVEP